MLLPPEIMLCMKCILLAVTMLMSSFHSATREKVSVLSSEIVLMSLIPLEHKQHSAIEIPAATGLPLSIMLSIFTIEILSSIGNYGDIPA